MTYMICPINTINEFGTLEEAKDQALLHSKKYGQELGGFAVFKVEEVGRYEHVSPIWTETTGPTTETWDGTESMIPQRRPPAFPADRDDEIPF